MGLVGRREAISAPTVGYASDRTPVSIVRLRPSLSAGGTITGDVNKSSKRASAISTTHTAHNDQVTLAAVRGLIPLLLRPCFLVPFVTTITLQHYLPSSITTNVAEPTDEAGPTSLSKAPGTCAAEDSWGSVDAKGVWLTT